MKRGQSASRVILVCLALAAAILVMGACARPSPAPSPAPKPPPAVAPATTAPPAAISPKPAPPPTTAAPTVAPKPAPPKVTQLKLGHWSPAGGAYDKQYTAFAKDVEEKTKGQVRITIYPGGSLGDAKTHFDLLQAGGLDLSMFLPIYSPGKYLLFEAFELPFVTSGWKTHLLAVHELINKGLVDKVFYDEVRYLAPGFAPPNHIFTKGAKVKVPADLKGVRIRSEGGIKTQVLDATGAATVTVPYTEIYNALERGVIEAAMTVYQTVADFMLEGILKYAIELDAASTNLLLIMNKKTYDGLPKDFQKIFDEAGERSMQAVLASLEERTKQGKDAIIAKGGQVYVPTPAEKQLWRDAFMPVWDDWLKRAEAKGLRGKELLHEYGVIVKRLGGEWPYKY